MSETDGFRVLDRRTFVNEDGPPESREERAEDTVPTDDRPTAVQHLEERTLRAEQQLRQYAQRYNDDLAEQVAKTRARLEREADRERGRLRAALVADLLEVLDNLDRSLAALPPDVSDGVRTGLILVRDQFFGALAKQGLTEVEAAGAPFDPALHEAADTTPVTDPAQDKRVLAVVKPGYRLGQTLVRPALVRVGRLA